MSDTRPSHSTECTEANDASATEVCVCTPDPPEAPVWFTVEEAAAWASGWAAGFEASR